MFKQYMTHLATTHTMRFAVIENDDFGNLCLTGTCGVVL